MSIWKNNSLSIVLFLLFAGSLGGQSLAGWKAHNEEQLEHRQAAIGYVDFLQTSEFGETVFENWEAHGETGGG